MPPKPTNVVTWTATLTQYTRRGLIEEARALFDLMPERNVVTWNSMLSAYARYGRIDEGYRLFHEMPEPNVVSYTCMLCGFARSGRVGQAKRIFDIMPERNVVSWNSMIFALIKNNQLEEARALFDRMPERSLVSWNIMISGYAEHLKMREARCLFDGVVGVPNVVTWTSLVAGYCRIGEVEEAYDLFVKMPERNVVSWTAMIGGFSWNGFYEEALQLFRDMKVIHRVQHNEETLISLLYACAGLGFYRVGRQLHGHLIVTEMKFCIPDLKMLRSLVFMYSRFGIMDTAKYLFDKTLPNYDTAPLNSIINGYICVGEIEKAHNLFTTATTLDEISWTLMISGYLDAGCIRNAFVLFNSMPLRDDVSWTVMISGLVENELFDQAFKLFKEMWISGVTPLNSTYSTLLSAIGALACLELGRQFHCLVLKYCFSSDQVIGNSLVSMYAKCGDIEGAACIFNSMMIRDVISWNSMILGLAHHGLSGKALELFESMKNTGIRPTSVTFLGLLTACSHTGFSDRGWELFNSMNEIYSIQPGMEHYICMIDLLGRAGRISEAEEFVMGLPFEPGQAIWGALLGMCSIGVKDVTIARHAAKRLFELDPLNTPAHVLLRNIYVANGDRGEEELVKKKMDQSYTIVKRLIYDTLLKIFSGISCTSQFRRSAGYRELIDLLGKHKKDLEGFKLDVYGNGEDSHEVHSTARKLELNLNFLKGRGHADDALHSYKVFISPSVSDVICTAIAEALAMGNFVVCAGHPSNDSSGYSQIALLTRHLMSLLPQSKRPCLVSLNLKEAMSSESQPQRGHV
ncbi:hypothetical protein H6P81_010666 [Aristolochia fimbriata]|uniref:Glycosyl transferase family 1 domain-containing protein n=1 Tax=Aristolochia fimbriata TaxID=158543 RepID=A0AAV7ES78_ARIFI|nr:hypothetical protein H6P81_010666 [Aristolochia fimbriata]